jgi:molybdopterin-guanine dinucleotide biosynthesis protein A
MNKPLLNGLILAGGSSSRMGVDKSTIRYAEKPQYVHLSNLLMPFCSTVFISGRTIPGSTIPVLTDTFEVAGPLNGILTAFHQQPAAAWLTVPVDMPNIDATLIATLVAGRNPEKSATCFYDSTGKQPEPLVTIWEPVAGKQLLDYYNKGGKSPREFLLNNPVQVLTVPDPTYLVNINTPEDLEQFRKTLQRNKPCK